MSLPAVVLSPWRVGQERGADEWIYWCILYLAGQMILSVFIQWQYNGLTCFKHCFALRLRCYCVCKFQIFKCFSSSQKDTAVESICLLGMTFPMRASFFIYTGSNRLQCITSWNTRSQRILIISWSTYFYCLQIFMAKCISLLEPLIHPLSFLYLATNS